MESAADDSNLLATDLAEYLVKKRMPFRKAHETVGQLVAECARKGRMLSDLPISKLKKVSPLFDVDVAKVFDVRHSLSARRAIGAPAPDNVKAQIRRWRKKLR